MKKHRKNGHIWGLKICHPWHSGVGTLHILTMSTTPTISIPAFSRLIGLSHQDTYRILAADEGPKTRGHGRQTVIPLPEAIQWVEAQARALRRDNPAARRIRRYEDAARELRVQAALHRLQNLPKRRRKLQGSGPGEKPHYDQAGALL
jgi:hypothetical protein